MGDNFILEILGREVKYIYCQGTTMLRPGCSVLRLRCSTITNEQTTQLAKRPICRRPQRGSVRSFRASYQLRGH